MLPKSRLHALSVCLSARLPGRQRATKRVWGGWHEHSPTGRGTGAGSVNGASCRCDADRAGVRVCVKWVLHRERGGRPRWWVGRERALGENLSLISRLGGANVACCVCERESRDWCGACASATRCMCISGILFTRTDHLYVLYVYTRSRSAVPRGFRHTGGRGRHGSRAHGGATPLATRDTAHAPDTPPGGAYRRRDPRPATRRTSEYTETREQRRESLTSLESRHSRSDDGRPRRPRARHRTHFM